MFMSHHVPVSSLSYSKAAGKGIFGLAYKLIMHKLIMHKLIMVRVSGLGPKD
jgi:hypothetical protein